MLLFGLVEFSLAGNNFPNRFRRMSPESGFYHNGIQAISQDADGYIWFITINELYKFDGYSFNRYQNIDLADTQVKDPLFFDIFNDSKKRMWIATNRGVFLYDIASGSYRLMVEPDEPVSRIKEDSYGNIWLMSASQVGIYDVEKKELNLIHEGLEYPVTFSAIHPYGLYVWIGTKDGRVYQYNSETKKISLFTKLISAQNILSIAAIQNDIFLLSGNEGVFQYSQNGLLLKKYTFFLDDVNLKGNNVGRSIYVDKKGMLWIASIRGLYLFDIPSGKYAYYTSSVNDKFTLPNNSTWTIAEDRNGGIWIGTYSGGLGYASFDDHTFEHIRITSSTSLSNTISSLAEDKQGNLWIGTEGSGLSYYDRRSKTSENYFHTSNKNSLVNDNVKSLVVDNNNNLWIGTYTGGIDFFDTKSKSFKNYKNDPNDPNSLVNNIIFSIKQESDSGIWIAALNGGIDFFHFKKKVFQHVIPAPKNQTESDFHLVNGLLRDSKDRLWIATRHGISVLNIKSREIQKYYFNPYDTLKLGGNEVFCMHEDKNATIWIGTLGYGLFLLDADKKMFTRYSKAEGLFASAVYGILDDDDNDGNLWLSTNDGLYKFDVEKKRFQHFDYSDGLQGNLFYPNSFLKCRNGELVFGGTNGVTLFQPNSIKMNPFLPKTIITGFLINNERVQSIIDMDGRSKQIEHVEKVVLNHKQTVFSFEFSAMSYLMPEKNSYRYKLEGYDDDWRTTSSDKRYASYSNLPPGNYTFCVNASNNDGIWSDKVKTVGVKILPPPWKAWWAYLIYAVVFCGVVLVLLRIYRIRKNLREQIHIERLSKENIEELNRIKIQFFTNISHEFKTPLTLISSPLKKIIQSSGFNPQIDKDVKLIQRNVTRLQNLINQLMDFRALENKKYKVKPKNGDLVIFMNELLSLFNPLIEERQIRLTFECQNDSLPACFDHDIFEKIFYNLLSNAVKFTPNDGQIILHLEAIDVDRTGNNPGDLPVEQKMLEFQVTNTGSTIPDHNIQHIFDNYYHIEKLNAQIQQSSGVGLAFTKELIELLNGDISVSSNDSETSFTIHLPLCPLVNPELGVDQPNLGENKTFSFQYSQEMVDILTVERKKNELLNENSKLPTLLIVEDNADLKEHLFDLFKSDYKVFVGSDGVEGLKLAKDKNPVVVISDVYMPQMTGIEMTRQLKSDILTSHIPIILLSAFNSQEQKNEGLETGADVYIEKPFDPDYLKLQVKTLLQSREAIRQAFSKKIIAEPTIEQFTSTDELFIQKALVVVEKNMGDSEFNVESFVREMGLGRTALYQKIKALTDLSVADFIQNIRLKKAAQLLRDTDLSISEVAYKVGFNEPKYFSTCFKKHFNQTPSGYIAGNKK